MTEFAENLNYILNVLVFCETSTKYCLFNCVNTTNKKAVSFAFSLEK